MTRDNATIPFNRPHTTGREIEYLNEVIAEGHFAGGGAFAKRCETWLEDYSESRAMLTHSCTAALEIAAILSEVGSGDEVILPSFTFVSTANAFVLRGALPVFVDVQPDTLNIDPSQIETAMTARTKAIIVVHYAGVACEMDAVMEIAARHDVIVIEDAAQCLHASYKSRPLGTIGHLGALSFHQTKNVHCGKGGALFINDPRMAERAEFIRDKGTNRGSFIRSEVDRYTWVDVGSSYAASELQAAFLLAQLEDAEAITSRRIELWRRYHELLAPFEVERLLRRPVVPEHCNTNGHIYYVLLRDGDERDRMLRHLNDHRIGATFHYVPLHSSPAGRRFAPEKRPLPVTENLAARLLRLPMHSRLLDDQQQAIVNCIAEAL